MKPLLLLGLLSLSASADIIPLTGLSGLARFSYDNQDPVESTFTDASTMNISNFVGIFDITGTTDTINITFRQDTTFATPASLSFLIYRPGSNLYTYVSGAPVSRVAEGLGGGATLQTVFFGPWPIVGGTLPVYSYAAGDVIHMQLSDVGRNIGVPEPSAWAGLLAIPILLVLRRRHQ